RKRLCWSSSIASGVGQMRLSERRRGGGPGEQDAGADRRGNGKSRDSGEHGRISEAYIEDAGEGRGNGCGEIVDKHGEPRGGAALLLRGFVHEQVIERRGTHPLRRGEGEIERDRQATM